jgi:ABC-type amino acid transport substrate-binding protein
VKEARRAASSRLSGGILCLLLLVGLFCGLCWSLSCSRQPGSTLERVRHSGILRVGTDATYPPFESVDPASGRLAGFDVDLVRALAGKMGAKAEFVIVPFDGIIPGLKSGKYDLVVSAMTITPERAHQVLFTAPYTVAGQSVVVRTAESTIEGPDGLPGRRIGCQLATTGEMEAKKVPQAKVVSFDAIGSAFRDLENKNLDAVIADTPTARIFIRDHPTLKLAGEPLTREEFGMAARLEDRSLVEAINHAMAALAADGEKEALEQHWGLTPFD